MIGESPKNVKDSQCFKCKDYDHIAAHCPSRNLLVRETNSDDDGLETLINEQLGVHLILMRMLEI